MKTYKGMTRKELIEKIVEAQIADCKARNNKKFGDNLPRMNENKEKWEKFYSTYPMTSKKYPAFSLVGVYDSFYA